MQIQSDFTEISIHMQGDSLLQIRYKIFCLPLPYQRAWSVKHTQLPLPIISYGCETWSLKLGKEQEKGVLSKIFGPKRVEVRVYWRKLHSEELHNFLPPSKCYLGHQIKECKMCGEYAAYGGKKKLRAAFWWGNLKVRLDFGRRRHGYEDSIKMDL